MAPSGMLAIWPAFVLRDLVATPHRRQAGAGLYVLFAPTALVTAADVRLRSNQPGNG